MHAAGAAPQKSAYHFRCKPAAKRINFALRANLTEKSHVL
jgi:hypothetical protein